MNRLAVWTLAGLSLVVVPYVSAEEGATARKLKDRSERGTLQDAAQAVRGDSGRWNDAEHWVHAPAPDTKAARFALDDWLLAWSEKKFAATTADDHWLLFSTRQLNDHDRVWIESVERKGNQLTVVVQQATWRGKYPKNFTYYQVLGVNVGRLEAGTYEATCVIRPATFSQFDGDGKPLNNWPKDEQPADKDPLKVSTTFTVAK